MSEVIYYPNERITLGKNEFDVNKVRIALDEDNVARVDIDLTKIFHVNKLDVTFSISKNEPKTFDELKPGDTMYVWWLNKLYSYEIDVINKIKYVLNDMEIEGEYDLAIHTTNGSEFIINNHCRDTEAFIYGSDGWHEYKIFGTSKEAVKKHLTDTLASDEKVFKKKRETWLKEFE